MNKTFKALIDKAVNQNKLDEFISKNILSNNQKLQIEKYLQDKGYKNKLPENNLFTCNHEIGRCLGHCEMMLIKNERLLK